MLACLGVLGQRLEADSPLRSPSQQELCIPLERAYTAHFLCVILGGAILMSCFHFMCPKGAHHYRDFLHVLVVCQFGLCWTMKTLLLVGPGYAPSFATAEKVQVEKLEYEAPTEVELMKEVEENFFF